MTKRHPTHRRTRWTLLTLVAAAALTLAACAPPTGTGTGTGTGSTTTSIPDPYAESEPNGTSADANPLIFNGTVWLRNGAISPAGDVDNFSFTPTSAVNATVSLSDTLGCANSVLTFSVLDPTGRVVTGGGSMGSFCPFATVRMSAGQQYLIVVRNAGGPAATPSYTLQLQ
jgi:hypothetical protein